jgi:hypothetical protein
MLKHQVWQTLMLLHIPATIQSAHNKRTEYSLTRPELAPVTRTVFPTKEASGSLGGFCRACQICWIPPIPFCLGCDMVRKFKDLPMEAEKLGHDSSLYTDVLFCLRSSTLYHIRCTEMPRPNAECVRARRLFHPNAPSSFID